MYISRKCVILLILNLFSGFLFCLDGVSTNVFDDNSKNNLSDSLVSPDNNLANGFEQNGLISNEINKNDKETENKIFSLNNLFIEGNIQRYIAIAGLEDYTMPKPGWNTSIGYDFFRGYSHSGQLAISIGHNVVAGSNPLVRMLDIWPLTFGLGYSYSPNHRNWQWLSLGINFGGGLYFSEISHYATVLDLAKQELTTSNGYASIIYGRVNFGVNFLDNVLKLRINAGLDCVWEIEGILPLPVLEIGLRFYPVPAFKNIVRKPKPEVKLWHIEVPVEVEKIIEVEKIVEVEKIIEVDKVVEIEKNEESKIEDTVTIESYKIGDLLNLYFEVGSDKLTQTALNTLNEIGKYLEICPEETILIQGHSAPFETERLQYLMGLNRANIARDYLLENFNIANRRIKVESLGATKSGKRIRGKTNSEYNEYRKAELVRTTPPKEEVFNEENKFEKIDTVQTENREEY